MEYHKTGNFICFSRKELYRLYRNEKEPELLDKVKKEGFTLTELKSKRTEMERLAQEFADKNAHDRDEHEVFAALFDVVRFYPEESKICFEMKYGFDPKRDIVSSLTDLNTHREGAASDFIIGSKDGFRFFQLKRYRDALETDQLLAFISKTLGRYGNDLGDTNLLIILQSAGPDLSGVDFKILHERLNHMSLKFGGWIMISYNENNKFSVMNHVYPDLATTRIPFELPSSYL